MSWKKWLAGMALAGALTAGVGGVASAQTSTTSNAAATTAAQADPSAKKFDCSKQADVLAKLTQAQTAVQQHVDGLLTKLGSAKNQTQKDRIQARIDRATVRLDRIKTRIQKVHDKCDAPAPAGS